MKIGEMEGSLSILVILGFGVSDWDTLVEYVPFYFYEHNEILTTLLVEMLRTLEVFQQPAQHSHIIAQVPFHMR